MANKCGGCQLYQGPNKRCDAGRGPFSASNNALSSCFKGPASLFSGKKCGGCRLYQGPTQRCGANRGPFSSSNNALSTCYSPIPG